MRSVRFQATGKVEQIKATAGDMAKTANIVRPSTLARLLEKLLALLCGYAFIVVTFDRVYQRLAVCLLGSIPYTAFIHAENGAITPSALLSSQLRQHLLRRSE